MINRIKVWGDSIMRGIVLNEQTGRYEKLNEKGCVPEVAKAMNFNIINNAKFGMTSEKGKALMEREAALPGCEPAEVEVIFFGGNDVDHNWPQIAADPTGDHHPFVPLEKFCKNISEMVRMVRNRGAVPVLATIPPISGERYFKWFSRGIEKSENIMKWLTDVNCIYRFQEIYSDSIIKAAKDEDCLLVDVRQEFLKQRAFLDLLCSDGIHPNERGHRLIAKAFTEFAAARI